MDDVDIRIIRTMGIRPYSALPRDVDALKPSAIARRIGVTPETVKARLARMEDVGAIRGYQVYPNLKHLSLDAGGYLFQIADAATKANAIKTIEPVEGLLEVHDFLGPVLCLDIAHGGGEAEARKLRLMSRLTGDESPVKLYARRTPKPERELDGLDWRILQAMRGDAKRSPDDIAAVLEVHAKTVRRRLAQMAEQGSFFAVPLLDAGRMEGLFPFILIFHTGPDIEQPLIHAILEAYDDRQIHSYVPENCAIGNLSVMVFATSAAEIEELRQKGLGLPGVKDVHSFVFNGYEEYSGWIDDAIALELEKASS